MRSLTKTEKQKILSRLFWDTEPNGLDVDQWMEEAIRIPDNPSSQQFFVKLLSSCDWYTILKIVPRDQLKTILSDSILSRLFPPDLKNKYRYARDFLSR